MTETTNLRASPARTSPANALAESSRTFAVAVTKWSARDEISEAIRDELAALGHRPVCLNHDTAVPENIDIVFSFAPYGEFLPIFRQWHDVPESRRPLFVHWNTEGVPDLRIPWALVSMIGDIRSWLGRLGSHDGQVGAALVRRLAPMWNSRMVRFRYVGDYYYAYRRGWLNVFSDSSEIYAALHSHHGLPTVVAPWGAVPRWYADLGLDRDIDVLWMGARATKRRSQLLDQVCRQLSARGIDMYVADNVENPFIFREERTRFLNRAKITLNLTRTWYDDNFSRFAMSAPNRSLVASEPLLPHCPQYRPGIHYVSAPVDRLADRIVYYLEHEAERQAMVERAYQLATTELAFRNSIGRIMDAVTEHIQNGHNGLGPHRG